MPPTASPTLLYLDRDVDDPSRYIAYGQEPGQPPGFDPVMEANEAKVIDAQDAVLHGRHMDDEW